MSGIDAALLKALRVAPLYCAGGDLAAQLAVTLSAIESAIAELRIAGFEIEERPGLGYRYLAAPDRLIADDLWARLGPSTLIREILVFKETDSTNDVAAQLGRNGAAGGVAVFAERQNAGRGRFGRRWQSAASLGLWQSLLLQPDLPPAKWPRLTTYVAVAIAEAIEKTLHLSEGRVRIKWPNDIQIDGKKVAGILIETGADRSGRSFAVLGIGINVNHGAEDFPEELVQTASSLKEMSGSRIDRAALAVAIFHELEAWLPKLETGFEQIIRKATGRSSILGGWIRLRAADVIIEGLAESLDLEGQLLVRDTRGTLHVLGGGEVTTGGLT
ncbi:MAG: bifunctional biotin--[acetyl-CoA-carboxylase] synthetase/biotin operon repressor [Chthoniobacteraceae bacterium]|nr:bifunctional biotin--[acetyl-CoA-carboxylase] synthetase/biotin operon repressor [Chthoniobacteraceae bacterium]